MDCTYVQIGSRSFRTKASSLLKVQNEQWLVGGSENAETIAQQSHTHLQKPSKKPTIDDYFEAIKQNINLIVVPLMKVSSISKPTKSPPSEKLTQITILHEKATNSSIEVFYTELHQVLLSNPDNKNKPKNASHMGLVDDALKYIQKKIEEDENAHLLWGDADSAATGSSAATATTSSAVSDAPAATNEFVTFIRKLIEVLFLSQSSEDVIKCRLPIAGVLKQLEDAYLESKPYKDSTSAGPNKIEKIPSTTEIDFSYGTFNADDYYLAYPVLIGDKHLHFGTIFDPLGVEKQFQMVGSVTSFNVLESLSDLGKGGDGHIISKDGFSFFVVRYIVRHKRTTDGLVITETLYGHVTFSYPTGKRPSDLHSICDENFYLQLLKDIEEVNSPIYWGEEKHSLLLPYYKKGSIGPTKHPNGDLLYTPSVKPSVSMTFDLDDTLLHTNKSLPYFREKYITKKENGEEEENMEWLHDPELIKLSTLLPNAKALKDMFIPFRIITSRRDRRHEDWLKNGQNSSPEPEFLARAIKEKEGFAPKTVVTDVSFGHQIKSNVDRETKKADDKYGRFLYFHNSTAPSGSADRVGGGI